MSPKATISQIVLAMFVGVVTRVLALSRFFQKFSGDCSWNPRFVDRLLDALIARRALIRNARDSDHRLVYSYGSRGETRV